jgi:formyl-CoA transferase
VVEVKEHGLGPVKEMGIPVKLRGTPGEIISRSPRLGEHTAEILTGLPGYSDQDVIRFQEEGLI